MAKWLHLSLIVASVLGVIDTLVLLPDSFSSAGASCGLTTSTIFGIPIDCGTVTTSAFSRIFGVPIAIFGFLHYVFLLIVLFFKKEVDFSNITLTNAYFLSSTTIALIYSCFLFYIQIFELKLICLYCMGSFITSALIFCIVSSSLLYSKFYKKTHGDT